MIIKEHKIWLISSLLLLALWLEGCSSHSNDDVTDPKEEGISLIMNVSIADISGFGTRAVENPDRFEQAVLPTEKIQTLRILIVDIQPGSETYSKVIHNYNTGDLGYARFNLAGIRFDNLNFSSKYAIYLIANEKGLSDDIRAKFSNTALPDGGIYPVEGIDANRLENIVIDNMVNIASGQALINNESSYLTGGAPVKPIPMTEKFEITTDSRPNTTAEDVNHYMERNFFITRAASKFSFVIKTSENYINDNQHRRLRGIRIGGLYPCEYLFPRNTVYNPSKEEESNNENGGREITDFTVPSVTDGNSDLAYSFSLGDGIYLPNLSEDGYSYNPVIYFAESPGSAEGKLTCTISYDGVNYRDAIELPNMPLGLPRNTHAIVYITIGNQGISIYVEKWNFRPQPEIIM